MRDSYELLTRPVDDEAQAEYKLLPRKRRFRWPRLPATGWYFGILAGAATVGVSILILLALIFACIYRENGFPQAGQIVLYEGDCENVKNLNTVAHIFINALSTLLLSASNYAMQILVAPTRSEVDRAHRGEFKGRPWLDIGVLSTTNLARVGTVRYVLWIVMAISSIPVHFFYNSTVFASTATYTYPIMAVNAEYYAQAWKNGQLNFTDLSTNEARTCYTTAATRWENAGIYCTYLSSNGTQVTERESRPFIISTGRGTVQRLDVSSCIQEYAKDFQLSRGSLMLVLEEPTSNFGSPNGAQVFNIANNWQRSLNCTTYDNEPYSWVCGQREAAICPEKAVTSSCRNELSSVASDPWMPLNAPRPVRTCYSERVNQLCRLQASMQLMFVVLALNAVKLFVMLRTFFSVNEAPLITIGDAIASFLERPDLETQNLCLASSNDIGDGWPKRHSAKSTFYRPRVFHPRPQRWYTAASLRRQITFIVLGLLLIIVASVSYRLAADTIISRGGRENLKSLWSIGFGIANPITMIKWRYLPMSGTSGLIWSAFVANSPQLALSLLYLSYNGIFTAYSVGVEWQNFMTNRKGLRVSSKPEGAQRSTYYLQLPYRIALPLMLTSAILHWLVSQSIFLVNIETYVLDRENFEYRKATQDDSIGEQVNILSCGFSLFPIIFVIILGIAMILVLVATGSVKHKNTMPVAASNSLAIAAACHIDEGEFEEGDVSLKPLQWGATGHVEDRVGHCCFSSKEVFTPEPDIMYA